MIDEKQILMEAIINKKDEIRELKRVNIDIRRNLSDEEQASVGKRRASKDAKRELRRQEKQEERRLKREKAKEEKRRAKQ